MQETLKRRWLLKAVFKIKPATEGRQTNEKNSTLIILSSILWDLPL